MHPHTPGPVQCGQRGNHRRRGVTPIGWPHHAVGPGQQRTEEALARSTHQHWDSGRDQFRKGMQDRPIMLRRLGESKPGIEHQPCRVDARSDSL